MRLQRVLPLALLALAGLLLLLGLGFLLLFRAVEISLPPGPPNLEETFTPTIQRPPLEMGSYDVLGTTVSEEEAAILLQNEAGRALLSRESGAIEITEELVDLGREAFYLETFGNEVFLTDVVGVLDGPINLWSVGRAILSLRGEHTTNLQIPIYEDITIGGRVFPAGSTLDTGLDVPAGSLFPLGMKARITEGRLQIGVTCAMCHVTLDDETGRIIEGATNVDIEAGLIIAMASNSAAFFRSTDVVPATLPQGERTYINSSGQIAHLPDAETLEDAVDAALLSWPPGTFDPTVDLENNPTFVPSSFTFGQWPYGWNGFGSIGWFKGLSTLNNNVHAVSADVTTDSALAPALLDMDEETYLGILLQNAAHADFRLPHGAQPSTFFSQVTPTPDTPGIIEVVTMPGYPNGSFFIPTGIMASRHGAPIAEHVNAMSAFQHSLAPPPNQPTENVEVLHNGAEVFVRAGCADCHSGRYFTNNQVIPQPEIGTQPSRATALSGLGEILAAPRTYPPSIEAPPAAHAPTILVPTDVTPDEIRELAYALDGGAGGYKVITLIGIYLHAPYLHDGGVAAGPGALRAAGGWFVVADPEQLGMAGTLNRGIQPDPEASLRVLLDRRLRAPMIEANRADPDLQRANVEGIGHEFWVDEEAGFTVQEQNNLILFLLSLDDDPEVMPPAGQESRVP